jgi:hypothetical protein
LVGVKICKNDSKLKRDLKCLQRKLSKHIVEVGHELSFNSCGV